MKLINAWKENCSTLICFFCFKSSSSPTRLDFLGQSSLLENKTKSWYCLLQLDQSSSNQRNRVVKCTKNNIPHIMRDHTVKEEMVSSFRVASTSATISINGELMPNHVVFSQDNDVTDDPGKHLNWRAYQLIFERYILALYWPVLKVLADIGSKQCTRFFPVV